MAYLDDRSKRLLMSIVDYPTITGKELQEKLDLSRKQLSYAMDKVNEYLANNGFEKIERQRTGKLSVPLSVIEEYKTANFSYKEVEYVYSEIERQNLIILILLCHHGELSTYDFTQKLRVSKNTFLLDLKKIQTVLQNNHGVNIIYNRKNGYTVIGGEYAKREILIASIRKALNMPNGEEVIKNICKVKTEAIKDIKNDIASIEKNLKIQFTDERLKELPYILQLIVGRIQARQFLDIIPEAFQHIVGTKEYSVTADFANKYNIKNQIERMFISSQIQISNIHYLKSDEYRTEKKLLKAADMMITNFEEICCVSIREREDLLDALLQHCKPAFYRINYNYHIENSILDMVLPQHNFLHEMVRRSSKPIELLLGQEIPDEELVYLTVLFGGWLRKEGILDIVEEKKKAVVVCTNGISVSNFLYITLQEYFPEIDFLTCLSIRGFKDYKEEYDIVFSTVRVDCDTPQFLVKPFLDDYSKQSFRQKVLQELEGVNLHHIEISGILNIIEKHATIHGNDQLVEELKQYMNIDNKYIIKMNPDRKKSMQSGIVLDSLLTSKTIMIAEDVVDWREAIQNASYPLLQNKNIENKYIEKMVHSIENEKPYIMIAEGVIIAHAGIDDGVNRLGMSLLRLPNKISINGYMEADIIIVLCTPDKTQHLTALYKLVEITESTDKMKDIRLVRSVQEIVDIIKN